MHSPCDRPRRARNHPLLLLGEWLLTRATPPDAPLHFCCLRSGITKVLLNAMNPYREYSYDDEELMFAEVTEVRQA